MCEYRFRYYFLILLISVVLAGCGSKEAENSQETQATTSQNGVSDNDASGGGPVNITLHLPGGDKEGTYEGALTESGIPVGEGMFTARNSDGVKWTYRGSFEDGVFSGLGSIAWEDKNEFRGTFKDGLEDGIGEWRYDGKVLYTGEWTAGRCTSINRPEIAVSDNSLKVVRFGERGFSIPDTWDAVDAEDDIIKIATDSDSGVVVQRFEKSKPSAAKLQSQITDIFENAYSVYGAPVLEEAYYEPQDGCYYVSYSYDSEDYIYPVQIKGMAFLKGRDTFLVSTFNTGVYDYSSVSSCIRDTFGSWNILSGQGQSAGSGESVVPLEVTGTYNGKNVTFSN